MTPEQKRTIYADVVTRMHHFGIMSTETYKETLERVLSG